MTSCSRRKKKKIIKQLEDSDFIKGPVIEIGSSSRCTLSTTRSKEVKDESPKKETQIEDELLSETKGKGKYEDCNSMGSCSLSFISKLKNEEMLLYVEATISDKVQVQAKKLALSAWNIGHLRKKETTKLEEEGFGLLPIKASYRVKGPVLKGKCSQVPHTPPKDMGKKV
ncbi:hypothetical protein L6452_25175 [Arctium lappa]|uniref:Uncharacterized protein n=1 Tax=Arctium lappa TaxID=4217 RepID=A0ACB9AAJ9_ARCLA|nr:hypothetical protein L6452_25175 [Arctium lappa]